MNVPRMLYLGMKQLNGNEKDILFWTMRKFFLLYDQYLEMNGLKKKEMGIDDLV